MIRNGLAPGHLLVVFAVIVLVFGGKKLPELARGMGQGLRIFKTELLASEAENSSAATAAHTATPATPSEELTARPESPQPATGVGPNDTVASDTTD